MRSACLFLLVLISAAPPPPAPPLPPPQRTASRPVRGQPVRDPLVDEAVAAIQNNALNQFAGRVEPELVKALADLKKPDLATIARLGTLREFARYFGRIEQLDEPRRQTLAWLIQNRELATNLMLTA